MDRPKGGPMFADALSYIAREKRWLEEWREWGLQCVHSTVAIWEDARTTLSSIGRWRRFLEQNAALAGLARSGQDVRQLADAGRTAVVLGFQNTAPIEHDIELITIFRELGILVMQLTYNLQNCVGCGYWEEVDTGLSSHFGRSVVEEMNRVGVLIDLSHCGDRTTLDAIETSSRPVSVTHSNPREYVGVPAFGAGRLTSTDALKKLAERGGFIGLSPAASLTREQGWEDVESFVEMVSWTADLVGTEAIGIGSDYCPGHPQDITTWWRYGNWSRAMADVDPTTTEADYFPTWFRSLTRRDALHQALSHAGFNDQEVDGILGENFLRVLEMSTQTVAPSS